jgi:ATP-dependent Lhr-like helicase
MVGGRWFMVNSLLDDVVSTTQRALAQANMLLERYGIVSREAALAEAIPGGFGPLYKVLSAMEESGQVRRGYFIEGLSGAQFARPGIVDRLRSVQQEETMDCQVEVDDIAVLPVIDPANPWGNLLPWPPTGNPAAGAKPRRVVGAFVLLHAGRPLLYLGANGRQLLTFPAHLSAAELTKAAFAALQRVPKHGRRRSLIIEQVDGQPVRDSAHYPAMLQSGFISDYRGLTAETFV